jgi:hypothetical protein
MKDRDLDPDEITETLHLIPTRAFRRGDMFRAGETNHARAYGMWMLSTEQADRSEELMDHCKRLLEWIAPVRSQIQDYRRKGVTTTIAFWWEPTDGPVGFTFPSADIRALADLCDDFDFYFA